MIDRRLILLTDPKDGIMHTILPDEYFSKLNEQKFREICALQESFKLRLDEVSYSIYFTPIFCLFTIYIKVLKQLLEASQGDGGGPSSVTKKALKTLMKSASWGSKTKASK